MAGSCTVTDGVVGPALLRLTQLLGLRVLKRVTLVGFVSSAWLAWEALR